LVKSFEVTFFKVSRWPWITKEEARDKA
jgi:hypothetical protein